MAMSSSFWFFEALLNFCKQAVKMLLFPMEFLSDREETAVLHYNKSSQMSVVVELCKGLKRKHTRPWWAINGHIETIATQVLGQKPITWRRETVTLPDGGIVALDWITTVGSLTIENCKTILLVLPGLTGNADGYTRLYSLAGSYQMLPVVFNKRGHGGLKISTPKLQSFGDPSDLRHCVEHIKARYPDMPLVALGYSAGSALLVQYMGDFPDDPLLEAGAYNSPGYDSDKVFGEKGISQPYNAVLTRELKKKIVEPNREHLEKVVDMEKVLKSANLRQLEYNLYCRLYGYANLEEYFLQKCNTIRSILQLKTPSLCINSSNDPICKIDYIPFEHFSTSPYGILALTKRGGHCGWIESDGESWADNVALDFLDTIVNNKDALQMYVNSDPPAGHGHATFE